MMKNKIAKILAKDREFGQSLFKTYFNKLINQVDKHFFLTVNLIV